ncbi:MAG: hypothetical protein K9H48_15800 [Melioribacteraceae bacterium]|nr:hypothetical protein [Saprospiraceae bacterium]MCF8355917.1 hypothetical protein [Melioribacteraceae bacterium]MCF8395457.1 hypothetical protein [Melioribacteraceae bacterium]
MKIRYFLIIAFFIGLEISLYSQSNTNNDYDALYFGPLGGLSSRKVNVSNYHLFYGVSVMYNWGNNLISLSYIRSKSIYINFGNDNNEHDNSSYQRFELNFGKGFRLSKDHKLFKEIYMSVSSGLAYNIFNYFENQLAWSQNKVKKMDRLSIPIGVSISNRIGNLFYVGFEFKHHVIQKLISHGESKLFFMVKIF